MSCKKRLSICYVVPGHDLLPTVGPSRNVVTLAQALSKHADVTIAFRRAEERYRPAGIPVLEIEPQAVSAAVDDAAMKGMGYWQFLATLKSLREFVQRDLAHFDVVLEKGWLLSGYVSALCARRGQLGVPIENIVVNPRHAARQKFMKWLRLRVSLAIAGRSMRRAPLIIAETEFLRREIVKFWGVEESRVAVADLGVDRTLFRPMDVADARARLGIDTSKTVLVYVGVLDYTHNLEPAIRALGAVKPEGVELHVIGDGMRSQEYRQLAAEMGIACRFHGRVPHAEVPFHIAAADLCLAPYDAAAFVSGELGYSTMKIPEYLSVGRPVVSVPSGRVKTLIQEGGNGFLFANEFDRWVAFLRTLPARARLREMCAAAASTPLTSWEDTALQYLTLCERQLDLNKRGVEGSWTPIG